MWKNIHIVIGRAAPSRRRTNRQMRCAGLFVLPAVAAVRTIRIAQFGDFSGPLRTFGPNTNGVAQAAVAKINNEGGVTLPDGETGMFEVTPFDSACNFGQALKVIKRLAGADFLVGIGPTCSGAAQPLFGQVMRARCGLCLVVRRHVRARRVRVPCARVACRVRVHVFACVCGARSCNTITSAPPMPAWRPKAGTLPLESLAPTAPVTQ